MKKIDKHLYENRYVTKGGEVTVRYYGIFTTWDRQPMNKALGDDLDAARQKLDWLHSQNRNKAPIIELIEEREVREARDRQEQKKEQQRKGTTFRKWAERYFKELVPPEKRASTVHQEELRIKTLNEFFGDVPLCDIKLDLIQQYRKACAGQVGLATTNLRVGFLRYLLNLAADPYRVLDSVPRIKLPSEKDRPQQRSVDSDEYRLILSELSHLREVQRVIIAWWETSMRHQEVLDLTWPMVDMRVGLLRLPAQILKERSPRRTPISYELRVVLDELRAEQSKIANLSGHVFTRANGQPIKNLNHAFDLALRRAKLLDDKTPKADRITPHSFRRAAITRWTDLGIPRDVVMVIAGHKPGNVHDGYIHLTDAMLVNHFREKGLLSPERKQQTAVAGSL